MWTKIPDVCLLNVMKRLSIRDLLRSGQTCTRWSGFKEESSAKRTRLTLIFGQPDPRTLDLSTIARLNTLFLNGPLSRMECILLATKHLRNIADLTIIMDSARRPVETVNSIIMLLLLWSQKLVSLKIDIDFGYTYQYGDNYANYADISDGDLYAEESALVDGLFRLFGPTINDRLSELTRLSLHCRHGLLDLNSRRTLDMNILERIREFRFETLDEAAALLGPSLRTYPQRNAQLALIEMANPIMINDSLERILQLGQPVARTFRNITYIGSDITMRQVKLIGANFTSLTYLGCSVEPFEFAAFTQALVGLRSLSHLRLSVHFVARDFVFGAIGAEEVEVEATPPEPLPSITELELYIWHREHDDLAGLTFGHVFPSVREPKIAFAANFCRACRVQYSTDEELEMCTDALVLPLLGDECPNVEQVVATHELHEDFSKVYVK